MKKSSSVSIVIIAEAWNQFLEESLPYYSKLNYDNFEVLVITTEAVKLQKKYSKVKFLTSAETKNKPAEKRDAVIEYSKADYFAFIDDDAYPNPDWLKNAMKNFEDDPDITAVGGPGLTPKNASNLEKASGWVSASPLGGFGSTYRFIPQKKKYIDDFPSMNLIVNAENFKKIGGFDSNFYPGEDTKLCLDLTHKLGKKIIYDPEAIVYHHKRPLFRNHLIQNGRFGLHRGHFARVLPETSRRIFYFIPSLFVVGLILGWYIFAINYAWPNKIFVLTLNLYYFALILYVAGLLFNSLWIVLKNNNLLLALLAIPGVFLTHFWYGVKFLQGLFSNKMMDNYGRSES